MTSRSRLITADELIMLPDDGMRHELLKGRLLSYPFNGALHGFISAQLMMLLSQTVKLDNLGRLCAPCGFKLESDPDTVLAPDMSFIRSKRAGEVSDGYPEGAPDLVVELLAYDDDKHWFEEKTALWFSGGALSVWLIDLETETVDVRGSNGERKLLAENDELTGGELIPGFRIPVSEIFVD